VKFVVDMNLSPRLILLLCGKGFTAAHWTTIGQADAPDAVIMAHAREHGLIILTQDLDFGAILAVTRDVAPSVVQIRSGNTDPDQIGNLVVAALRQTEQDLRRGALLTIDIARSRLNLLPLINRPSPRAP
jgi:predicted nuclease of predicted toxin-antitoxin system